MKYKTTRKAVTDGYNKVYCVGYCEMQALLRYSEPVAYTCGVYGWNADVYSIGNNEAIVTGYRPFGKNVDHKMIREYEKAAEKAGNDWSIPYEEKKAGFPKCSVTASE